MRWLIVACVVEIAIAVIDFATSSTTVIIGLVALPVIVAAIVCPPRQVAVAAALATVLVIVSGAWDHNFGTGQYVIRLAFVVVASLLAVLVAVI